MNELTQVAGYSAVKPDGSLSFALFVRLCVCWGSGGRGRGLGLRGA